MLEKEWGKAMREIWDLYDENRNLMGKQHFRGEPLSEGEYHLVVHICIFNSENQLLIQQRQRFKEGWPGMWDFSAGGSACKGETSLMAAERETREELGLDLNLKTERPVFTIHFKEGFDDYYIVTRSVDIETLTLQESEVAAVKWVDHQEATAMVATGEMIPYVMLDTVFALQKQGAFYWEEMREIRKEGNKLSFGVTAASIALLCIVAVISFLIWLIKAK